MKVTGEPRQIITTEELPVWADQEPKQQAAQSMEEDIILRKHEILTRLLVVPLQIMLEIHD